MRKERRTVANSPLTIDAIALWMGCSDCGKPRKLRYNNRTLCRSCYARQSQPIAKCHRCGVVKRLRAHSRTVCFACYAKEREPIGLCCTCNRMVRLSHPTGIQCGSCYMRKSYGPGVEIAAKRIGQPCDLCQLRPSTTIDHCHKKVLVRGALCNCCNVLLAMAGDDQTILSAAIGYLRRAAT